MRPRRMAVSHHSSAEETIASSSRQRGVGSGLGSGPPHRQRKVPRVARRPGPFRRLDLKHGELMPATGIPMILTIHSLRQVPDLVDRIGVFRRARTVASLRKDETDGNDSMRYITGAKGGTDAGRA